MQDRIATCVPSSPSFPISDKPIFGGFSGWQITPRRLASKEGAQEQSCFLASTPATITATTAKATALATMAAVAAEATATATQAAIRATKTTWQATMVATAAVAAATATPATILAATTTTATGTRQWR